MNDRQFLSILNAVSQENGFQTPVLGPAESPSSEVLAAWAAFLEGCVREDVALADPRWQRVTIESNTPYTRFTLVAGGDPGLDSDFRVGLQLLLGLLDDDGEPTSDK